MLDVLTDASRVAHYHPLRPEVPLEVLTLDLCSHNGPSRVREAIDAVALLHATGPSDAFHSAMIELSPWRNSYLYAKGLSRDTFPLLAVEVTSALAIEAAETFFSMRETNATFTSRLGLFLRVQMTDEGTEDKYDSLSRIAEILRRLKSDRSRFELKMVEFEFDTDRMGDRELEMARRVLALALHEKKPTPAFKTNVGMIGSTDSAERTSLAVWGKLFQTLCRVGAADEPSVDGNELGVSFAERVDPRIVTAFWSAVAFSSGYSRLTLRSTDTPLESVEAKYMALAFLSPVSQVTNLDWFNSLFRASAVDAMLQVQFASSQAELSRTLLNSGWSSPSHENRFQLAAIDESIARQFGWVLHDSGDSDWIDVFLPGYGQCSIEREQWNALTHSQPPSSSGLFEDSKLTRFETVMQLQNTTTHLQAARFLGLVGGSLQVIELKPWRDRCTLDVVLAMFESCPHLRELTVHEMQLASESVEVEIARLVSTRMIKLKLQFVNDHHPTPPSGVFTETFFASVLPVVGQQLEYLEIRKQHGIIPFAQAFRAIAQSCSSLFHLKLAHLNVGTLDPLIEAYRDGRSRISSLYLQKSPVESAALIRFAAFLGDRTCPGSRKLGVFHITQNADTLSDAAQLRGLDAASIKAMLEMLEHNHSLTELYIGVTDTGVGYIVSEPLRPFKRRFDIYDEQELPVASESYPLESTVAFVDVLQRKQLPYTQETVRIVTAFAAQRIRRSVRDGQLPEPTSQTVTRVRPEVDRFRASVETTCTKLIAFSNLTALDLADTFATLIWPHKGRRRRASGCPYPLDQLEMRDARVSNMHCTEHMTELRQLNVARGWDEKIAFPSVEALSKLETLHVGMTTIMSASDFV